MRTPAAARLSRPPLPPVLGVACATATAALFVVQAARRGPVGGLDVVLLAATCAPLAWQRVRPFGAAVLIAVLVCLTNLVAVDTGDLTAMFALVLVPAYALGRRADRGRALLGLAIVAAASPLADALSQTFDPTIFVADVLFVAPAWAIGRAVRSRSALVHELAAVNAALEAERADAEAAAAGAERARIARELHDIVAHALSLMVLHAAGARLAVARAPDASIEALGVVEHAGGEALAEMSRLLGILRPGAGHPAPVAGLARVGELAARAREAGLALDVAVERPADLAPTVDLAAFRIVQEAVTNAVKHAAPTSARLAVRVADDVLHVVVEDDGNPAGPRRGPGTGHGLLGIRERVELHGGVLDAAEQRGGGFRVHARLPVA